MQGAPDRSERVAKLVSQQGEKLVLLAIGPEQVLDPATVGHVAGDLGEALESSILASQRGDDDIGPEPPATLPDPPSFVLDRALPRRGLELPLRAAPWATLSGG